MILGGLDDVANALRDGWGSLQRFAGFWGPVVNLPMPVQAVATIGTLLALVAVTGVALTSLALLLTSLLFLYLLLTQVFGVEIDVALPR